MPSVSVSVIVPCYNYGRYLRECVESVLNQTGVDVRVLIVDDASTDDSPQVGAQLAAEDRRVQLLLHEINQGVARTYNEGLFLADSTYTVLIDSDDMLTAGSLSRACMLMEAHPEVGFVYGRALVFTDDQPPPRPNTGPSREMIWHGRQWFETRCQLIENCIRSPEVVMRTSLLRRIGGFREELPHTGDMELWMRFALHADVGYIAGPDQAFYRDHAAGLHRTHFSANLLEHEQMCTAFEILIRDYGNMIPNRTLVEAEVRLALARRALQLACSTYDVVPFDSVQASALEAMAGTSLGPDTAWLRRQLRLRKTLGWRLWRTLLPIVSFLTFLPRRWEYQRRRTLETAGLVPARRFFDSTRSTEDSL